MALSAMLNLTAGPWMVINDDVMGGQSSAAVTQREASLLFAGNVSLENNGGFSSTRRLLTETPDGMDGIRLVVRGDGKRYQLGLRHDQRFDGVSWRQSFDTSGEWQELELRFSEFQPVFRGNEVDNAGPARPEAISQLGFLISDAQEGGFALQVKEISFFTDG